MEGRKLDRAGAFWNELTSSFLAIEFYRVRLLLRGRKEGEPRACTAELTLPSR
jgi:hypothetical protein